MKYVGKCIGSLASAFLVWLMYYLTLPTLSLAYFGGFLFFAIVALVIALNIMMWASDYESDRFIWHPVAIVAVVALVMGFGGGIIGGTMFNHSEMSTQIGEIKEVEFSEMISQIDTSQIPIVDDNLAQKIADKKIGEDVALGSRARLGDAKIQDVNGEIIYVAPLEHTGFWKWKKHQSTPGYITVSATNQNKVKYVTEVDGNPINVVYAESAYGKKDLKRHIRNQGYTDVGLTEFTFELNNEGMPFWVVTTYENTTIWGNPEATGVVIVDAQTGETNWYSTEEIPEWVDIVHPDQFIVKQIDNWGTLKNGWPNFSGTGKIRKTDLLLTVYVNGDCYYFTGMTSTGSDESCVGFIMVNTRDKSAEICYMSGATEKAAMKSAEGEVRNYGYNSTEPLPLNVNGIPTYVMALKDDEGLVKSYAMVNVEMYSIVAQGKNLAEASRAYIQAVAKSGQNTVVGSDEAYGYTLEGKVFRISSVVEDGSTYYYIIVEGEDKKIFTAGYHISDELAITRDGDTVVIEYIDDHNGTVDIIAFDNTAYGVAISEDQQHRDELDEGSSALDSQYNEIIKVDPDMNEETWNSLSDEEKAKLIQELLNKGTDE